MQVTIVNDRRGDPEAHKAGCQHVDKNKFAQNHPGGLTFEADSHEGVVAWFYDDQLAEAEAEARDNLNWVPLAPCLRKLLPAYEPTVVETDTATIVDGQPIGGADLDAQSEQLSVRTPQARVRARRYVVKRASELTDVVGVVRTVHGKEIVVSWGALGVRSMRASHLMLDR